MVAYPKTGSPAGTPGVTALMAILYEYPTGGGLTDWNTISAAAPPIQYAIVNPASGPGSTQDANWLAAVKKARANGITLLGYVDTNYGAIATSTVQANIALWSSLYGVSSIFFDRADTTAGNVNYYTQLANVIHATPGAVLVTNHGTNPIQPYANIADICVVFENNAAAWASYTPASWMYSYPPSKFCAIPYNVTSGNLATVMGQIQAFGIGNAWVTDENDGNWTALPSYLATETGLALGNSAGLVTLAGAQTVTGVKTFDPVTGNAVNIVSAAPANALVVGESTSATASGAFVVQTGANGFAAIYDTGNTLYYGLSRALPSPAGTSTLGGYFKGLGVGGSTNGTATPIFGVLTSTQSNQGVGHTAFTVTDSNVVDTFNNVLDDGSGNVSAAGSVLSSSATAGVGYKTGAGGTVTQATSKATTVVLSKAAGQVTMNNASLAAGTIVSFTLTNTAIAATDVLILNHVSGGTPGSYGLNAQCAAGSAVINVRNNTGGALAEAIVLSYVLVKGVTA